MDQTDRHPADQLALQAASLPATSSLRPASPRSPRRPSRRHNGQSENQSWVGGSCVEAQSASTHEPRTYDCLIGDLYDQGPF